MKIKHIRIAVILFWLCMAGWLIRYIAFPEVFTGTMSGYHELVSSDMLMSDSWMKIMFNDVPIGYSHTSMELNEADPLSYYRMHNTVRMNLKVMGTTQRMTVETTAYLNALSQLQKFKFEMSSSGYEMQISAWRTGKTSFNVLMDSGTSKKQFEANIPNDAILYSPMTEMALKKLKVGQKLIMRTVDPASMSVVNIQIKAVRKELITNEKEEVEATVLESLVHGMRMLSWIDADGEMLRQETPFGWTLERCSAMDATDAFLERKDAGDILLNLAVPCKGRISNLKNVESLTLRLTGVEFARDELETDRQDIVRYKNNGREIDLLVRRGASAKGTTKDLRGARASTISVQSDHPEIVKRAKKIVRGKKTDLAKARAIYKWVYKKVKKKMTVSLPSALDVLRTMEGDCNEHTYLFTGLARAANINTRIKVGLAYQDGSFYYHAWPAVYINDRWLEMDPTWGQEEVDAGHIALLEGELASQLALAKVIGTLKIEILEEKHITE